MILVDPNDVAVIVFEWEDAIPATSPLTTLTSVAHDISLPMSVDTETTDVTAKTSQAKVSGGIHGGTYLLSAEATLSNGEIISRSTTLRCIDA